MDGTIRPDITDSLRRQFGPRVRFEEILKRFELCGEAGGITVSSDYGHHPAEIRATLAAAREGFGRRLVVLFQPHRYTRTRDLFEDFLDAFDAARVARISAGWWP